MPLACSQLKPVPDCDLRFAVYECACISARITLNLGLVGKMLNSTVFYRHGDVLFFDFSFGGQCLRTLHSIAGDSQFIFDM